MTDQDDATLGMVEAGRAGFASTVEYWANHASTARRDHQTAAAAEERSSRNHLAQARRGTRPIHFPQFQYPRASILIVSWRQQRHLLKCLEALRDRLDSNLPYEVVLLFNGTLPEIEDVIRTAVEGVTFLKSAVNLGFGGGCNLAATGARGEYLVLLNDDAIVEPGWLEWLVATAEANAAAGAVCSCVLFPDGRLQEAGSLIWSDGSTMPVGRDTDGDSLAWHFVRRVDYGSACSLLVRRATWEAIAGADPQYHPAYYEDVDLCLAIRARGQHVLFEPRSRVRHHESVSSDGAYKSFLFRRNHRRLQEKWARDLAFQEPPAPWSTAAITRAIWRARNCPRRILLIDDRVPDPAVGSGDGRMFDALIELSSHGYALSMFPASGAKPPSDQLVSSGVAIVVDELSHHLARPEILYDAVVISRPHNFSRWSTIVRTHQPKAVLVYDCEALFWRRIARQAQVAGHTVESRAIEHEAELMRRVEEQIVVQADFAVALSAEEADILARVDGHCPIEVVRPAEPHVPLTTRSFADRRDIGYIAGWLAGTGSPNADGLRWFVAEVLPRVKARIPWVRLRVTGASVPPDLRALADPNVVFEGHVADLGAFYEALRVAISPIRFGAGVKLKTVQALQYGVPIVSTTFGAEGIDTAGLAAIDVADDPESFAALVVTLLTDGAVWNERRTAIAELIDSWRRHRSSASWVDVMAHVWTRRPGG